MNQALGVRAEIAQTGEVGILLPLLGDHHVHLGLIDPDDLTGHRHGNLGFVLDLGGNPAHLEETASTLANHVATVFAGQFLCAPGGYPSDRSWAPAGSVRFVDGVPDAESAVTEQVRAGASVIKVTLHRDAGPVLDEDTLVAICTVAHRNRLPVIAHAEGTGMTALALAGGVDALAHTPFTEVVKTDVLEGCVSRGMAWISTFDIHGYGQPTAEQSTALDVAMDNAWRFVAAGGDLLYGTDIGNGPLPLGVNMREVELLTSVGLDAPGIIASLRAELERHATAG